VSLREAIAETRNRVAIDPVLHRILLSFAPTASKPVRVLEVGTGWATHAAYFNIKAAGPQGHSEGVLGGLMGDEDTKWELPVPVQWHMSDRARSLDELKSSYGYVCRAAAELRAKGLTTGAAALEGIDGRIAQIDFGTKGWGNTATATWGSEGDPATTFDLVFTSNTLHYCAYDEAKAMFHNLRDVLRVGGILLAYGPFNREGKFTSDSNVKFDAYLKRNVGATTGIRDLDSEVYPWAKEGCGLVPLEVLPMPENNFLIVLRREQ
jgi:hypothetical protein